MVAPIVPHWAEALWEVLGKPGTVLTSGWPAAAPPDFALQQASVYLEDQVCIVGLL